MRAIHGGAGRFAIPSRRWKTCGWPVTTSACSGGAERLYSASGFYFLSSDFHPLQFGINTFLFTFPFTNKSAKLFPQFKAWGFDAVEIAIDDPAGYDPHLIRDALDRSGLVCNTVCGAFGHDRDLRGAPEHQQNSLHYMMSMLDQMVVLGARILAGPVYSAVGRAEATPPRERARQWKTVVKHLKRLCDYAGQRGIRIAVEPLNRFETDFLNTVDDALALIADVDSPAIGLHYDTFHTCIARSRTSCRSSSRSARLCRPAPRAA